MRRVVVEPQPILWRRLSGRRLLRRFLSELWLWLVFAGRGGDDDHQRSAGDYRTCRNVDPDLLRNGAGPQTPRRQEEVEAETQAQSTPRLLQPRISRPAGPPSHRMAGLGRSPARPAAPPVHAPRHLSGLQPNTLHLATKR